MFGPSAATMTGDARVQRINSGSYPVEPLRIGPGADAEQQSITREVKRLNYGGNGVGRPPIEWNDPDTKLDALGHFRRGRQRCQTIGTRRVVGPEGRIAQPLSLPRDFSGDIMIHCRSNPESATHVCSSLFIPPR
jgi:hypothetical protein